MKGKLLHWSEEVFNKAIKRISKESLVNIIKEGMDDEELKHFELGRDYPLSKNMLGVPIEYGLLRIQHIALSDAIGLARNFVKPYYHNHRYELVPFEDLDALTRVCEKFNLEKPDPSAVEGYILNHELVKFVEGKEFDYIRVKYKDDPQNIFYVYKFYFAEIDNELYLVIEKNI
jgi:hypothetical protein